MKQVQLENQTFVIFDTETTGLMSHLGDEIIEIAAQKIYNREKVAEFYNLINPRVPVTDGAYRVHGLSNEYLANNGVPAEMVLPDFFNFIGDAILVGHNILCFDLNFINRQSQRLHLPALNNLVIDTLVMSRKLLPKLKNHKLSTVAEYFNIDVAGAHRAQKDVEINKLVFLELLNLYTTGQD